MDDLTSALMDSSEPTTGQETTIHDAPQTPESTSGAVQSGQRRDLYQDPDVKALMSARDRAHAQQLAAIQQQYASLQQQYESVALKDMDDFEKAQWQAQKAQQEAARYRQILEQQQQAAQLEAQKRQDLERLSNMTGISAFVPWLTE